MITHRCGGFRLRGAAVAVGIAGGFGVLAGLGLAAMQPEPPDTPPIMTPEQIAETIRAAGEPTEQHRMLRDRLVGTWDVEARFIVDPSAEPDVSTGRMRITEALGGVVLICEMEMDMSVGG